MTQILSTLPDHQVIRSFPSEVIIRRTQDGYMTRREEFTNERDAHDLVDALIRKGYSEHSGYLTVQLWAKHPTEGKLLRRELYINE
jgi:hypothetical protein